MLDIRASAAILMLLSGACAPLQQPDLVRLYAPVAAKPKVHPLIVIPGVMGSRLRRTDNDREVWPGSFWNLMIASDFDDLALTIPGSQVIVGAPRPPKLKSGGFFHEFAGEDFYGQIVRTFHCVQIIDVIFRHQFVKHGFEIHTNCRVCIFIQC